MARFWFSFILSVALGFVLSGCQVDTPIIKPVAGEHYAPIVVDISVPKGEIHYTLDGSEPNRESQRYSGPFKIESGNVTVKAKAFDRFMGVEVASGVSSANFDVVAAERRAVVDYLKNILEDSKSYTPISFGEVFKSTGTDFKAIHHVYRTKNKFGGETTDSGWFVYKDNNEILFHLHGEPEKRFVEFVRDESSSVIEFFDVITYPRFILVEIYEGDNKELQEGSCMSFADFLRSLDVDELERSEKVLRKNRYIGERYVELVFFTLRVFPEAVCSKL